VVSGQSDPCRVRKMRSRPFTRRTSRAWAKFFWAATLRLLGILALAKAYARRHGIVVLTFHRVLAEEELKRTVSLPGMIVRSRTFDEFLEYAHRQFEIVDLAQDPDWRQRSNLRIAVTFDDGWSDNATVAFPLARKHNVPVTIFIVPERTGAALPFWPEQAASMLGLNSPLGGEAEDIERAIEGLKALTPGERKQRMHRMMLEPTETGPGTSVDTTMSWEQIFQLRAGGVTFGSHTSTHEILPSISLDQAGEEIAGSRRLIERKTGGRCTLFSYPNGNCSPEIRGLVAKAGYSFAFLNQEPGVWTETCDSYLIPRMNVCEYHLANAWGKFSPLIFDYAVVLKAAQGLLSDVCAGYLLRLATSIRSWGKIASELARDSGLP
jgi:peptidoglycan/xylan/chitin deacetylase (PgdA/CDA1 family)